MNESFVLFTSYIDTVKWLSHEEAGVLLKMILNYEAGLDLDNEIKDFEEYGEAYIAFTFIKRQLDKTDQKYSEALEKQREAGKKGAGKRWGSKEKDGIPIGCDSDPIAPDSNPINPNGVECHNEYDNDNNLKEKDSKESKKKSSGFSKPTVEEVRAYCLERKNNVDPQMFVDFYEAKGWKVGSQSMKDWKACVRTWEQRNRGDPPKAAGITRGTDYDALIRRRL